MKGWQIFVHSLRQVTGNFEAALRVSGLLYVAQTVVGLVLLGGVATQGSGAAAMMQSGFTSGLALGFLLVMLVALVTGLWIAVGWHRYILLGEAATFIPAFRSDRMLAYFLRSLGYGAILILLAAVWGGSVGFAVGSIFSDSGTLAIILMALLIYLPLLVIGFRITADLPAAAIGG